MRRKLKCSADPLGSVPEAEASGLHVYRTFILVEDNEETELVLYNNFNGRCSANSQTFKRRVRGKAVAATRKPGGRSGSDDSFSEYIG